MALRCVVSPLLVLLFTLALTPACDLFGDDDTSGMDGGGNAIDSGMAGPDAPLVDPNCEPVSTQDPNGRHNAGRNCISSNCHDGNGQPPQWTIAGTLYTDSSGSGAVAGATMVFTDATGAEIKIVTADNGNFYTGQAITFPITAKASLCPNTMSMGSSISESMAGCNQPGCHDAARRIFLPQ